MYTITFCISLFCLCINLGSAQGWFYSSLSLQPVTAFDSILSVMVTVMKSTRAQIQSYFINYRGSDTELIFNLDGKSKFRNSIPISSRSDCSFRGSETDAAKAVAPLKLIQKPY